MNRTFVDQDCLLSGFYPDETVHFQIGHLRLVGGDNHPHIANTQTGGWAHIQMCATIERARRDQLAIRQAFHDKSRLIWGIAEDAGKTTQGYINLGTDSGDMRSRSGLWIDHVTQGRPRRPLTHQGA